MLSDVYMCLLIKKSEPLLPKGTTKFSYKSSIIAKSQWGPIEMEVVPLSKEEL